MHQCRTLREGALSSQVYFTIQKIDKLHPVFLIIFLQTNMVIKRTKLYLFKTKILHVCQVFELDFLTENAIGKAFLIYYKG